MAYMVVYLYRMNYDYRIIDAENTEDCIIQFADYVGDCSDLLVKALKGCEDVNDYVDMYNQFGQYKIQAIYIIEKTLYDVELM